MTKISSSSLEAVYQLSLDTDELGKAVAQAISVIELAIDDYGYEHLSMSFNGGKDCTVLLHIYAAVLHRLGLYESKPKETSPPIKSIYIPMPSPFKAMEDFIDESESFYNLELFRVPCAENQNGPTGMKAALELYRKERTEVEAILIGVRRGDPHSDSLKHRSICDPDWPQFMRIHPVLEWSYEQVWQFLRKLEIPYCELYDQGYTSLGSTYNTFRNPSLLIAPGEGDGLANGSSTEFYRAAYQLQDGTLERCGRGPPSDIQRRILDNNTQPNGA